jgi:hypothetical protein
MAKFSFSNTAAKAGLDAALALLNAGGAGSLVIYSGTAPADADTALSGNTALATFTLETTAFGAATDAAPGATAALATPDDVTAAANGTATFARLLNNAGTCVAQLDVGTSGASITLSTTTFVSGQPVTVTSLNIKLPEGDTF